MPKRIQRQRTKGWRMPAGCVYVGRPTKWGNPFAHDDAAYAVRAYRRYSRSQDRSARGCTAGQPVTDETRMDTDQRRGSGHTLGCRS